MKKPHIHAELIKAWANGAEIQHKYNGEWEDTERPQWIVNGQYRIKPEPKKDFTKYFKHEFNSIVGSRFVQASLELGDRVDLCVTWNGETEKIKSVEILK